VHRAAVLSATKKDPPSGPPWDLPLAEAPLAFVDLEMTGLEPAHHRVVEVCIERVVGADLVARVHTLVRPEGGESGNVHVHGLAPDTLAGAPSFAEIAADVERIVDGAVLVAHGASWDVAFLEAEMRRAGRTTYEIPFYLDTLNLSRRTLGLARHSLDALRAHFGLDASRAHRADADVAALREVFVRCVAELQPTTPRDVWEVRIAERRARDQILAECKDLVGTGREVTLHYRPRGRGPEATRMVLTAIEDTRDPPRVLGYELPGRGRRELRADRILRVETEAPTPP